MAVPGDKLRTITFSMPSHLPVVGLLFQLISNQTMIPKTAKPPVIFLNGYENTCGGDQFVGTFGKFDQWLQSTGRTSLIFDNCAYPDKPAIEDLGNHFRDYLASLKYQDGTPVSSVDVVAHSMGGLIVRSYLAGKQTTPGVFQPPVNPGIRKIVFLATPNFGTPIATALGIDTQSRELASGSIFVFDLATWNQGTDDLRGIDSLALIGNAGTGRTVSPGFDDGLIALTSASIGFAEPGKTRILPYCHTSSTLLTVANLCPPNAPSIATGASATDPNVLATLSFLNDTQDWTIIGQSPQSNTFVSTGGGLEARARSANNQLLAIQSARAGKDLNIASNAVAWTDLLPAQPTDLVLTTSAGTLESKFTLPAGYTTALTVKAGPFINRIYPAAAAVTPLGIAPGSYASLYGMNLGSSGVQLTVGGSSVTPAYASNTQLNFIVPDLAPGAAEVVVSNSGGSHSINTLVTAATPALFTQDQSGSGLAAALYAVTNARVTSAFPLQPGEYVSLFLTGLGAVHTENGLQVANTAPTVTVGGETCTVTYAGRAPGFPGLDQVNCRLALDLGANPAAPVVIYSGGRASNTATLPIS